MIRGPDAFNEFLLIQKNKYLQWDNIARKLALGQNLCRNTSPFDCTNYHANFNLLVLLGVIKSPDSNDSHLQFFTSRLKATCGLNGNSDKKVLILGLATPAMADIVHQAIPDSPVVVADACETPLETTRQVFNEKTKLFEYKRCDALSLPFANNEFACVVNDSFYTRLVDAQKALKEVERVLNDEGALITTWKIKNDFPSLNATPYFVDAEIFEENLFQAAKILDIPISNSRFHEIYEFILKMQRAGGNSIIDMSSLLRQYFPNVDIEKLDLGFSIYSFVSRQYAGIFAAKKNYYKRNIA